MKLTAELFQQICATARIKLSLEESIEPEKYLESITESFSKIQKINTDGIEPSFLPVKITNVMREDTPKEALSQEEALSLSTQKKEGYFKGPKAL